MRRVLICFLILVAFLGSSCTFLAEEEVETTQSKIIFIYATERYINIKVTGKVLKIFVPRDTKITKGGKEIKLSNLNMEDKIDISYEKRDWLSGLVRSYSAKTIKVVN